MKLIDRDAERDTLDQFVATFAPVRIGLGAFWRSRCRKTTLLDSWPRTRGAAA